MTQNTHPRRRRWLRRILLLVLALMLLCLGVVSAVFVQNRNRPTASVDPAVLNARDQALAAEFFQLRTALGDTVWPGWGSADIPVVLYNESYAFLIGYADPPAGWMRPAGSVIAGGPWSLQPNEIGDRPVYRQPLPPGGQTPQAFTVRVGERWAASMTTREWMGIAFAEQFGDVVPPLLAPIFPYVPLTAVFLDSSDFYIAALAHESFHAFVGQANASRLLAAEASLAAESGYPWDDEAGRDGWAAELDLLMEAVRAEDAAAAAAGARAFLDQRGARRAAAGLTEAQITLEQEREWSEGMAKYVELAIWQAAANDPDYRSLPALDDDSDFDAYANFSGRWSQETAQIGRSDLQSGEGRFYYTGMAQAFLLDQLLPGWKAGALASGVYLEDLLLAAVTAAD